MRTRQDNNKLKFQSFPHRTYVYMKRLCVVCVWTRLKTFKSSYWDLWEDSDMPTQIFSVNGPTSASQAENCRSHAQWTLYSDRPRFWHACILYNFACKNLFKYHFPCGKPKKTLVLLQLVYVSAYIQNWKGAKLRFLRDKNLITKP